MYKKLARLAGKYPSLPVLGVVALVIFIFNSDCAAASPPVLVLDGIVSICGNNEALIKADLSGNQTPLIIKEGQTVSGIKLISVDFTKGIIMVRNLGEMQTIKICETPKLQPPTSLTPTQGAMGGVNPAGNYSSYGKSFMAAEGIPSAVAGQAGQSGLIAGISGAANANSNPYSNNDTPATPISDSNDNTNPNQNGVNTVTSKTPDPWWLAASKNLERARAESAALVLRGEAEPFPLTPLTPPGTPAALIGPDKLYFGHAQ